MPWVECPLCGGTGDKVTATGPVNENCRNCDGTGRKQVSAMDRG